VILNDYAFSYNMDFKVLDEFVGERDLYLIVSFKPYLSSCKLSINEQKPSHAYIQLDIFACDRWDV
jgi:hypothetical protein